MTQRGFRRPCPLRRRTARSRRRTGGRTIPAPIVSFNGVGNRNGLLPPDTNGEIGPNHYLQIANVSFAVYNRDGSVAYGPANNNLLFTGTPLCGTHNQGDPLVLYDQFSQRWMASQFATGPDGNYECISVSATNDPTGAWCGYEFLIHPTKFGDYPKFGVWPTQNAFVMTVNQFAGNDWGGVGVYGFERDRMLACEPARFVYEDMYDVNPNLGSFLPADPDGSIAPPDGAPIPFVTVRDGAPDALSIWSGAIDWSTPSLSVTHDRDLTVASFSSNLCGGSWNCIPQPGTTVGLEPSRTGSCNGSPTATSAGGRRWSSTTRSTRARTAPACAGTSSTDQGSGWGIGQQGTFAPADGLHRWMGSVAQDSSGDIALGYSVSELDDLPEHPLHGPARDRSARELPQGEESIVAGAGSQLSDSSRWGDYSAMSVDPNDDCTFWYTQEYYAATGNANWRTRVGAFRFPGCGPPPPPPPPTTSATAASTAAALRPVRQLDRRRADIAELRDRLRRVRQRARRRLRGSGRRDLVDRRSRRRRPLLQRPRPCRVGQRALLLERRG